MPTSDLALDQPLPPALSGSGQGWLTRYRRWPVFSRGWRRGRLLVALLPTAGLLLTLAVIFWNNAPAERPYAGSAQLLVNAFWPLLAGPWLAGWVRARGWPLRRETWALWGVMGAVVATQLAFNQWLAEPLKQAVAEATGQVDEQGRRIRTVLAFGLTVTRADRVPAPAPAASPEAGAGAESDDDPAHLMNGLSGAVVTFLLAGGLGIGALRREREALAALARQRELEEAQTRRRDAEVRLSVLAAQVEPHFLFNTLAGVRSAIATDPARASDMVDRLVAYLRAAIPRLRSDGGVAATLDGQMALVRAYLALMQSRMPRLAVEIDVPPDLGARPFPPLMLISLAENAVKHGVEPKVGAACIAVQACIDEQGRLAVTVADDGVGFGGAAGADAGSGLGLANLRERLQQLYAGRAELVLRARPEGGVAATIAVPQDLPTTKEAP